MKTLPMKFRCCRCQRCTPFLERICPCGGVLCALIRRRMLKMGWAA